MTFWFSLFSIHKTLQGRHFMFNLEPYKSDLTCCQDSSSKFHPASFLARKYHICKVILQLLEQIKITTCIFISCVFLFVPQSLHFFFVSKTNLYITYNSYFNEKKFGYRVANWCQNAQITFCSVIYRTCENFPREAM